MDNPLVFGIVFMLMGLLAGAAILVIVVLGTRKSIRDELDERGFYGRRKP